MVYSPVRPELVEEPPVHGSTSSRQTGSRFTYHYHKIGILAADSFRGFVPGDRWLEMAGRKPQRNHHWPMISTSENINRFRGTGYGCVFVLPSRYEHHRAMSAICEFDAPELKRCAPLTPEAAELQGFCPVRVSMRKGLIGHCRSCASS